MPLPLLPPPLLPPRYLSGLARHYRQTVLLTSHVTADMNALFGRACSNYAGKARLVQEHAGVLGQVVHQVCVCVGWLIGGVLAWEHAGVLGQVVHQHQVCVWGGGDGWARSMPA